VKDFGAYLLAALVLVTGMCGFCQYVIENDSFYHLGHAQLYWEKGSFFRPFPWPSLSMISKHNADIWWGFHVFISPLHAIKNKEMVMIVAPGVLMLINLLICRVAVVRMKLPHWCGLALLPASVGFLTRMDTVRPLVISSALLLLLFAALATEWTWVAVLTSILIGFIHPTLSYLVILVAFATVVQRRFAKGKFSAWTELSCVLLALVFACLRPGLLDGLQLLKVQLFDLMLARRAGEITNFGVELNPADQKYFMYAMLGPVAVLFVGLLFAFRTKGRQKSEGEMIGAMLVVLGSLLISMLITRRGVDQVAPFAILGGMLLVQRSGGFNILASLLLGGYSAFVVGTWGYKHQVRTTKHNITGFKKVGEWLTQNTEKGEIVGNALWSDFGPLFYWNRHNRFFSGMDPVFQYRRSPENYWLMTVNAPGRMLGRTSPFNPMKKLDEGEDLISTLWPEKLQARYMVIATSWNRPLQEELKNDPKTKMVYRDDFAIVYEFSP
jgi:hypothetical protein